MDFQERSKLVKSFEDPNYESKIEKAIKALPRKMRTIAQDLFSVHQDRANSYRNYQQHDKKMRKALEALSKLSASNRRRVFAAFFPLLGDIVEDAWQLHKQLSYQTGYTRKAFRAPNNPALARPLQESWFIQLFHMLLPYDQEITWLAAWTPTLFPYQERPIGILLAAALERGDQTADEVYAILKASALGEHETGLMGSHIITAFLLSSNPEAWEFIEKLLLAAQRQEGLRQAILEAADLARPEPFIRILRLILSERLVRFSSVIRALDVWLGFELEAAKQHEAEQVLERLLILLDDKDAREKALSSPDPETLFLALWAVAFFNAEQAVPVAENLLTSPTLEIRFVAVLALKMFGLQSGLPGLLKAMKDADLQIVVTAIQAFQEVVWRSSFKDLKCSQLFEDLEHIFDQLPKKMERKGLVWPWMKTSIDREHVLDLMFQTLGKRSPFRLEPFIPAMNPNQRYHYAQLIVAAKGEDNARVREQLMAFMADRSPMVREKAYEGLAAAAKRSPLSTEEVGILEDLLRRKSSDTRRACLKLLLSQKDRAVLSSINRLLAAKDSRQQSAGLELLTEMQQAGRSRKQVAALSQAQLAESAQLPADAEAALEAITGEGERLTLEDGLGLFNPAERTHATPPSNPLSRQTRRRKGLFFSPEAQTLLVQIDGWIHEHRNEEAAYPHPSQSVEMQLLGNIHWLLPQARQDPLANLDQFPMGEPFLDWADQLEDITLKPEHILQAQLALVLHSRLGHPNTPDWTSALYRLLIGNQAQPTLRYTYLTDAYLTLLFFKQACLLEPQILVDALEETLYQIPSDVIEEAVQSDRPLYWHAGWRRSPIVVFWQAIIEQHLAFHPDIWSAELVGRVYHLFRWLEEPLEGAEKLVLSPKILFAAYRRGKASDADIYDLLTDVPEAQQSWYRRNQHLNAYSALRVKIHPDEGFIMPFIERIRARVVEVELTRGDLPGPASPLVFSLRYSGGMTVLLDLVEALGNLGYTRGYAYSSLSRKASFSHLIQCTYPDPNNDTPAAFAAALGDRTISQKQLIELAMYAPQWAAHVQEALDWPGLEEAVWWMHAHTKDSQWHVEVEIRNRWQSEIGRRTQVKEAELLDGAVDVAWFERLYPRLGEERWEKLYQAAKYTSSGAGHARARLFADAMLGNATRDALDTRAITKRHQDSVKAIGLLPLPDDPVEKEAEIAARYEIFQEVLRTGKKFGSQRKANEKRAVEIGLENLAYTAGYDHPSRLMWALEAREAQQYQEAGLSAKANDITVTLEIAPSGEVALEVLKDDGRQLKAVPGRVKKDPEIKRLIELKRQAEKQATRMRQSLEEAMVRGERFSAVELQTLLAHPVLRPILGNLVFHFDGANGLIMQEAGRISLKEINNKTTALVDADEVRLAHPHDLLVSGIWGDWQQRCFEEGWIQPFKQVFREWYQYVEDERKGEHASRRYAGQQLNPRQAVALLGARAWVVSPNEGAHKTFHKEGITALVYGDFGAWGTPAEVEGQTMDTVQFHSRDTRKWIPLPEVPSRLFSEVMRDLDLVVSVAHAGGVDPEASLSTIEMRKDLITQMIAWMKIGNVTLKANWALIEGQLASYNLHLGSGVVHIQPGGALCIIPVQSQHRGRIFLPFADSDPKTAEVISKMLLLAEDKKIKDPTILSQISARSH